MMKIFNIIKANKEIGTLNGLLATAQTEIATLTKSNTELADKAKDYEATIAAFPVADYEKTLNDLKDLHANEFVQLTEAHEEAISTLRDQLEAEKASTSTKAANIVASIGIPVEVVTETKSDVSTTNVYSKNGYKIMKVI